jgi:protein-disulfide isomerase
MNVLKRLGLALAAVVSLTSVASAATSVLRPDDMTLGNAKAKVTVIEYASLSCPHCARFNNDVFPAFKKKYVDSGKVRYVYREFLTDPAEVASAGALAARCAGPKRYFAVIDAFFHGQDEIYATGQIKPVLLRAAKAGGLNEAEATACLADKAGQDALDARVTRNYEQDKIQATPTFVINGKVLQGQQTLQALDAVIRPLLAK